MGWLGGAGQRDDARVRTSGVLLAIAEALSAERDGILATACLETHLLRSELEPEFARMVGTLRAFSALAAEGSWCRPVIDTRAAAGAGAAGGVGGVGEARGGWPVIGPAHDVRSMLVPRGPVAVFGSSNFPLAYGVCGGDTASALAAGCAVVVKEHPAHPRTGRLLAGLARGAIARAGGPRAMLGYVPNADRDDLSPARGLLASPWIAAVGFTGSAAGGTALQRLADARRGSGGGRAGPAADEGFIAGGGAGSPGPIPVFAEMGSINPVSISRAALGVRGEAIAAELVAALALRHGQQCTKPGLIVVPPGRDGARFIEAMAAGVRAIGPRALAAPWIERAYWHGVRVRCRRRGVREAARSREGVIGRGEGRFVAGVPAVLLVARWDELTHRGILAEEIFGPATVVLVMRDVRAVNAIVPGTLTWTIYAEEGEAGDDRSMSRAAWRAGRVVWNGVPTGVRVCPAMVHGGPWPATNRSEATAVGARAIERWCRSMAYQNVPDALLPLPLRNGNPWGLERLIDGERTRGAVPARGR